MDETRETADRDELRRLLGMEQRRRPAVLLDGQMIGEAYRIERELGAGGMGVVYLARDVRLSRDVAIKVHAAVAGERLLREAAALAQLVHPHVVTVHEIGSWNHHPYVVMEYVPGGTARTWRAAAPRRVRAILELYLAAGRGLAAAHAAGLVHRDFKPDNVLVGDDGRVRVADFGLARAHGEVVSGAGDALGGDVTATGTVMGTPAYMAPEQREGGAVGPAADQYAFAVALWEAIEGARPGSPPTPSKKMPRAVSRALTRALAAAPEARWPSMNALLAELARNPAARRRRIAIGAAALGGVAVAGAALAWWAVARAQTPACGGAHHALDAVWTPARRDTIHAAFLATGRPYAESSFTAAVDAIDRYAAGWTAARIDACEATSVRKEQPPEMLALRDACLDRDRAAFDAMLAIDQSADGDTVDRSLNAVLALDDVADCADAAALSGVVAPPGDATARDAYDRAQADTARARAQLDAGHYDDALTAARDAVSEADASGDPDAGATARLALGAALVEHGDPAAARDAYEAGAKLAGSARDDRSVAMLWLADLAVLLGDLGELPEADRVRAVAEAAVARAGTGPALEASLSARTGALEHVEGKLDDARVAVEHAIAIEPDPARVPQYLELLGLINADRRDFAAGRDALDRAEQMLTAQLGADHPRVALVHAARGRLLMTEGKAEDARATYADALAAIERVHGEDSVDAAQVMSDLAGALDELGREPEAIALLRRASTIEAAHLGGDTPQLAGTLDDLANAEASTGDLHAAVADLEHSLAIRTRAMGPDNPRLAETLRRLAMYQHDLGDQATAESELLHARDLLSRAGQGDSADAAVLESTLSDVLDAEGKSDDALAAAQRGLEIAERALGPDHLDVGHHHFDVANELAAHGRLKEARAEADRARQIVDAAEPGGELAIHCAALLGDIDLALNDARHALAEEAAAVAGMEKLLGDHSAGLIVPLYVLASAQLATGDAAGAVRSAQRALDLDAASQAPNPSQQIDLRVVIVQARWAAGIDRGAQVTAARSLLATLQATHDPRATAVADWLHKHPR